jgi:hypothetical protein
VNLLELKQTLSEEREALLVYLLAKYHSSDWHGVQDAASDLRDIDCQLQILEMKTGLESAVVNP